MTGCRCSKMFIGLEDAHFYVSTFGEIEHWQGRHPMSAINMTRRTAIRGGLSLLAGSSVATLAKAEWGELNLGEGLEDFWLATDAYIYGYPLVTMEMTRRVATNVAKPEGTRAPMGNLIK